MRVEELEAANAISSHVNDELTKELDRLGQYSRRLNLIFRNVFLPEKQSNEQITDQISKMIKLDLNLYEHSYKIFNKREFHETLIKMNWNEILS